MARLQDFQTVTPTSSDKLLVVQSQGQGLATFGSTIGAKMDKTNPSGNGSLSLNRKSGTTVGYMSTTEGTDGTATGNYSHAGGYQGVATSFASYAEGQSCEASGYTAHAQGLGTKANHRSQFAFGEYNVADASTADATAKGNYIEVVGKGTSDANRSNARTLDWSGNEVLAGGLKINGNQNVVADATGQITILQLITAGYITGSGNYVDFNYYLPTKENATITFNSLVNTETTIFTPTARLNNIIDTTAVSITRVNRYCLKIELKFTSTQTPNQLCTVSVNNLTITIT